ncbi:hypothetical protein [Hymenobacter sp. GOD-10R]|uniref:hypothetical protein n=1 Tax=Hymenobacter sp. GOD-10R TaxID=3093922 RepID=UPI002D78249F|nr:hypothetical protein [Hymenobacter sp. GOD-10R]WRQ31605.1 hypothetical protein SD425_27625 [Hymenobacter sp. GOD-10R]
MRTFLFILTTAIFLYSPYGPSWGRDVVNIGIVLTLFSFFGKALPKGQSYNEHEDYN